MGDSVAAVEELDTQNARLEERLSERLDKHPDAKIVRSLPGLGTVLGAVLSSVDGVADLDGPQFLTFVRDGVA
jgi:hypothetical protein